MSVEQQISVLQRQKADRPLGVKTGLFSSREGYEGDIGLAKHRNKIYIGSKIDKLWRYTELTSELGKPDKTQSQQFGNVTIYNDLTVDGTLTLADLTISGDLDVGGTLDVTGASTLSSTLGVTGASTLSSTLAAIGIATFTAQSVHNGGIDVNGSADISVNLNVDGATTLDQTTVNVTDGDFMVTGSGNIFDVNVNLDVDNSTTSINSTGNITIDADRDLLLYSSPSTYATLIRIEGFEGDGDNEGGKVSVKSSFKTDPALTASVPVISILADGVNSGTDSKHQILIQRSGDDTKATLHDGIYLTSNAGIYATTTNDSNINIISDKKLALEAEATAVTGSIHLGVDNQCKSYIDHVDIGNSDASKIGEIDYTVIGANGAEDGTFADLGADAATLESAAITQTSTSGNSLSVTRNLASTSTTLPVVDISQDHASDDQTALHIVQQGNGYFIIGEKSSSAKFTIAEDGDMLNTNGNYGTLSDIRLKENIIDATPKLDEIDKLRVVNFNLKGDSLKQIGFIGQELKEVFPALVPTKDTREYNNDGNVVSGYEDSMSIKSSILIPIMVKAIQELKAELKVLKANNN